MTFETPFDLQLAMPFPDYEMIDSARAERILGAGKNAVIQLIKARKLAGVQKGEKGRWAIRYWSVVDYCDWLHGKYAIPMRRSPLAYSGARYRDDELLPFPITTTISVPRAMSATGLSKRALHAKLESGQIESYQLLDGWDWRISAAGLAAFIERSSQYSVAVTGRDFRVAP